MYVFDAGRRWYQNRVTNTKTVLDLRSVIVVYCFASKLKKHHGGSDPVSPNTISIPKDGLDTKSSSCQFSNNWCSMTSRKRKLSVSNQNGLVRRGLLPRHILVLRTLTKAPHTFNTYNPTIEFVIDHNRIKEMSAHYAFTQNLVLTALRYSWRISERFLISLRNKIGQCHFHELMSLSYVQKDPIKGKIFLKR